MNEISEVDYSNYYYNVKAQKRQSKKGVILVIFVFILCFVGAAFCYSKMNSKINSISVSGSQVIVPSSEFFAVSICSFSKQQQAEDAAQRAMSRGGGGYVYYDGNVYHALVSLYADRSSSKNVSERLISGGELSSVVELKSRAVQVNCASAAEAIKTAEVLKVLQGMNDRLVEISIELDKSTMSPDEIKEHITTYKNQLSFSEVLPEFKEFGSKLLSELTICQGANSEQLLKIKLKHLMLFSVCELGTLLGRK